MELEKPDITQPIRFSIGFIRLFGMWKIERRYNSYKIYGYLLNVLTSIITTILMITSVLKATNFEEFIAPLFMGLTMVSLSMKIINIFSLRILAVSFIEKLQKKDLRIKSANELKIFKTSLRIFHLVSIGYTGASFVVLIFGFTSNAFGSKWVLPYPAWMPFDYKNNSRNFWWAYAYQFVSMCVACLTNVSMDMLLCYFLKSVSLIFFVIGSRLANIGDGIVDHTDGVEVNKVILQELKEIIHLHYFAKKLAADSERLLSLPIFTQLLLSAFVLCFTGYQLSSLSMNDGRFIEMLDFLFVMSLQIYLPCHYGNQVTLEAEKLSQALYSSDWTPLPQKSKKIISLYMEFLNEPVVVKAGKFFQVGIPIFAKTVNNAYSFFAILVRMQK